MSARLVFVNSEDISGAIERLLNKQVDAVRVGSTQHGEKTPAIFPGAFNPLHNGHRQMAQHAARTLHAITEFEISVFNVDKPPLELSEVLQRVDQFGSEHAIWLTCAATFAEKSRLFPNTTFLVGVDTVSRIADPVYYDRGTAGRDDAIDKITRHGCMFLVFGRTVEPEFVTLSMMDLPQQLAVICREVSEVEFRIDVSSTDVRNRQP